jgi:hypothetical protein
VHVERYRDGKLVTGGEVVKKKDKKAAAAMPTVTLFRCATRAAVAPSSRSSAMVPLEGSNSDAAPVVQVSQLFSKEQVSAGHRASHVLLV